MLRIPSWREKTEEELVELVRAAWEGRLIGTWQLDHRATAIERIFPGYQAFAMIAGIEAAGFGTFFSSPHAEREFTALPWPAAAYGVMPEGTLRDPKTGEADLPIFHEWEMLSWPEWERLRAMLGYPPPKRRPREQEREDGPRRVADAAG